MLRLIIADAHVGTASGDAEAMGEVVDRCLESGVEEIIYLGDSFKYLIGMAKFWTSSVSRVVRAWDRARAEGVRIRLIEGNRDFFLDEPDLAARVDETALQIDFLQAGTRYRLVHGDKVNQRDFQYLFWSRISKAYAARLWARVLPRSFAVHIVRSMETHLSTTNTRFRYVKPEAALKASADDAFSQGVDVLLWGHFHALWEYATATGFAMVVPAWLETRQALLVQHDGSFSIVNEILEPTRG